MKSSKLMVAAVALAAAGSAHAATAVVDGIGGAVSMNPHNVAGVFGAAAPSFTVPALMALHSALNSDGIATDGYVTAMFLETDAGLAWAVLVDQEFGGFESANADLSMTTSANGSNVSYINDAGSDITGSILGPIQTAAGSFTWDADNEGEGFAWAGLVTGDFMSFNFTKSERTANGLVDEEPFQFVSWDAVQGKFVVVAVGDFTENDQFAYSVRITTIPLPQPAILGMAGLLGVGAYRRRKM